MAHSKVESSCFSAGVGWLIRIWWQCKCSSYRKKNLYRKEFIDEVKEELRNNHCTTADIGWYQITDLIEHTGIVILMNKKKTFRIDFGPQKDDSTSAVIRTTRGSIDTGPYNDTSTNLYQGTLATLNKKELIKFVEYCLCYEVEHNYNSKSLHCRNFVRDACDYVFTR